MNEITKEQMLERVRMWYRRYSDGLLIVGGTLLAEDIEALALIESAMLGPTIKTNLTVVQANSILRAAEHMMQYRAEILEWLGLIQNSDEGSYHHAQSEILNSISAFVESFPSGEQPAPPPIIPLAISPEEGKKIMASVKKFYEEKPAPPSRQIPRQNSAIESPPALLPPSEERRARVRSLLEDVCGDCIHEGGRPLVCDEVIDSILAPPPPAQVNSGQGPQYESAPPSPARVTTREIKQFIFGQRLPFWAVDTLAANLIDMLRLKGIVVSEAMPNGIAEEEGKDNA